MSEIDWDKAPEGATHYVNGSICPFEKRDGEDWYYWKEKSSVWIKIYNVFGDERIKKSTMHMIERPSPTWSGEGLPPVGVVCEAAIPHTSGPDNERSFIWIEGSVIAYYEIKGKAYAWFAEDDGFYPPNVLEFRPIRTPEQIAADEREQALREACEVVGCAPGSMYSTEAVKKLIDAGYRKP